MQSLHQEYEIDTLILPIIDWKTRLQEIKWLSSKRKKGLVSNLSQFGCISHDHNH